MATKKLLLVDIRAGTSDARFHKQNLFLPVRIFSRVSRHLRTRADEAHVSQQNVMSWGSSSTFDLRSHFPNGVILASPSAVNSAPEPDGLSFMVRNLKIWKGRAN